MAHELEKIQVDKIDVEDALECVSALEGWSKSSSEESDVRIEFWTSRLRVCLEHMLTK